MFKGFDVKLDAAKFRQKVAKQGTELWDIFVRKGKATRTNLRDTIGTKIASGKWVLSGSDIESNWFPKLMNHVFISHSHQDEDLALALAGALRHWMKLDAFVDSSVWGYYADLQKLIYQKVTSLRGELYGTQRTELENSIVSHVHCMLTKSLVQMMDQCECLIFLNTPSSIGIRDVRGTSQETYSPWIYTEVEVSRFLRTHEDPRRPKTRGFAESVEKVAMDEAIRDIISYPLNLDHMAKVDTDGVWKWICAGSHAVSAESNASRKPFVALDKLYEMT
jgi:hypothetical protein